MSITILNFWNKYQFAAKYMQFHRNFRLMFSLHLSENAKNVHFGKALRRTNSELLPPGWLFPIGNTYCDITYLMYTILVEKGAPPVLYRDIYFKDC